MDSISEKRKVLTRGHLGVLEPERMLLLTVTSSSSTCTSLAFTALLALVTIYHLATHGCRLLHRLCPCMVGVDLAAHRHEQQLRRKARLVVQLADAKLRTGDSLPPGLQRRLQAASLALDSHHSSEVPAGVLEHMGWK